MEDRVQVADDNRRFRRHRVVFPVKVSSRSKRGRLGMCRNGSACGMLMGTPSRFELGDELVLSFQVRTDAPETIVTGKIVRVAEEAPDRDHWCHRLVAVEFDQPQPTLARVFAELAPTQSYLFT